ncbi:MAG: hypothetical protein QHC90_06745 [Shinella sp.]|nr:hypothetical protein [Shinella sp.]
MVATTTAAEARTTAAGESSLPLELIELELSLDGFAAEKDGFAEAVRDAAGKVGGDFLFELPASGLAENCQKIAALRIPDIEGKDLKIVFALLDETGSAIRVEDPSEKTEGLRRFADAFVDVLEHI